MSHAIFLSNRLYHSTIKMSPYQALYNKQSDFTGLTIFGSKCYYKRTKTIQKDMDISGESGIFLGYTATTKNIYIKSDKTNRVHIVLHKLFDKAYMTTPLMELPPMAEALQNAGYNNTKSKTKDKVISFDEVQIKIQLLSDKAIAPSRSTPQSAGFDLHSTIDAILLPYTHLLVPINIAIEPHKNTYAQICTRSSFASKGVSVLGGVLDPDY